MYSTLKTVVLMVVAATSFHLSSARAADKSFIYVSNAEDGTITSYILNDQGIMRQLQVFRVGGLVMPLASNPRKNVLYAGVRSAPFKVHSMNIDPKTGILTTLNSAPLKDNMLHISTDNAGNYLFASSNSGDLIAIKSLSDLGEASQEDIQVIKSLHYTHAIKLDWTNRFAFAPSLGENAVEKFIFDARHGTLRYNDPRKIVSDKKSGLRHLSLSPDNQYLYVVSQFLATVEAFSIDHKTGSLKKIGSFEGLADTTLAPGKQRPPVSQNGAAKPDVQAIWAADIQITPDGSFVYITERTTSQIIGFKRNESTEELTYINSLQTEEQPRSFSINKKGDFLVVAGEKSDHISSYSINRKDGSLKLIDRQATGKGSAWVEIVSIVVGKND